MPRKPEQLKSWTIYKVAAKVSWLSRLPTKGLLSKQARKNLRQTHGACTRCRGNDQVPSALLTPSTRRTIPPAHPFGDGRYTEGPDWPAPLRDAGLSARVVSK